MRSAKYVERDRRRARPRARGDRSYAGGGRRPRGGAGRRRGARQRRAAPPGRSRPAASAAARAASKRSSRACCEKAFDRARARRPGRARARHGAARSRSGRRAPASARSAPSVVGEPAERGGASRADLGGGIARGTRPARSASAALAEPADRARPRPARSPGSLVARKLAELRQRGRAEVEDSAERRSRAATTPRTSDEDERRRRTLVAEPAEASGRSGADVGVACRSRRCDERRPRLAAGHVAEPVRRRRAPPGADGRGAARTSPENASVPAKYARDPLPRLARDAARVAADHLGEDRELVRGERRCVDVVVTDEREGERAQPLLRSPRAAPPPGASAAPTQHERDEEGGAEQRSRARAAMPSASSTTSAFRGPPGRAPRARAG